MTFLNLWAFFIFIPLYIIYKQEPDIFDETKIKQRKLLYLSISFILLSITRPVILDTINEQKFDAQDYIIAIDVSYSMQANDLVPTRYDVAKQNIQKLITHLSRDRFSIFAFTSNAILISPPTLDTEISMMALNVLNPEFILTKGTSLLELLDAISKISYEKKNLIIFSDGGEDHDLSSLITKAKKNHIIPYIVATGSSDGAILKKNNFNIKDENNNLVISRLNPILKNFALQSGGKYYELDVTNSDVISSLISDLQSSSLENKQTDIQVLSFSELFYIPLFFAMLFFILAVTKIRQLPFALLPLFFLLEPTYALSFDSGHVEQANKLYKEKLFLDSAKEFQRITPSVQSYYNTGVSYYQAGYYKEAVKIFSQIQTKDKKLKQNIFYNMGNCAVKLQKYERAKIYYTKALAFGYDEDSFYNLTLLYKLRPEQKVDVSDMLRKKDSKQSTQASKKNNTQDDESKSGASNSNQQSAQSSTGSSSKAKKSSQQDLEKTNKTSKSEYKIGYKAYELINKGYTNEKHPW
jgi:Ca-activated chloride channel family protein